VSVRPPVVIKIGGAALDAGAEARATWADLAAEHARQRGLGRAGVVLVHGGGAAVDRHLVRVGHDPAATGRIEGLRITPEDQIDEVAMILGGLVNARVVARLRAAGAPAVGMRLADAGACALELVPGAGRVGRVAPAAAQPDEAGASIRALLDAGFLPVVASIGLADDGDLVNVNADDAASGLAAVLAAASLVLLTDVEGVRGADGSVISELGPDEAEAAVRAGVIGGGMVPKVRSALEASARSGAPVTITTWRRDRAAGAGTVVRAPRSLLEESRS